MSKCNRSGKLQSDFIFQNLNNVSVNIKYGTLADVKNLTIFNNSVCDALNYLDKHFSEIVHTNELCSKSFYKSLFSEAYHANDYSFLNILKHEVNYVYFSDTITHAFDKKFFNSCYTNDQVYLIFDSNRFFVEQEQVFDVSFTSFQKKLQHSLNLVDDYTIVFDKIYLESVFSPDLTYLTIDKKLSNTNVVDDKIVLDVRTSLIENNLMWDDSLNWDNNYSYWNNMDIIDVVSIKLNII